MTDSTLSSFGFGEMIQGQVAIFSFLFSTMLYWGPFVLGYFGWKMWLYYRRAEWVSKMDWVMLEVRVPKEVNKTPLAMEVVLSSLYQSSRGVWWDWYWKGRVRDYFTLEMVSIEGAVRFFIRTAKVYKNLIEAAVYAQYPDVEIHEVPDYTKYVDYRGKEGEWDLFGAEFKFTKPDPYPIKTYVDYGLDREGTKEIFKTDPLSSVVEVLGSMGAGEQFWLQINVQVADDRFHSHGTWFGKHDWRKEGEALIKKLSKIDEKPPEGTFAMPMFKLTEGEREVIKAVERSISKMGFDCGIRAIYLAKRDQFRGSSIKALLGILRVFNTRHLNGFAPTHSTGFDFPWQDWNQTRATHLKEHMFHAYKRRSYFYPPHKSTPITLNSEELATIFHFPGSVTTTPTFGRVESKKGEPPVNLPR
ncbi:MAG: hypothetical protein A2675_02970 [Candidatus Yonathbacteria bacterium RIFCSPHIGHO2_01_FULL_51_10]|uniref:DUF8128 domain-containing protein n=1 Tax=Candidatus Yonathbacteria bacterium RIFCSPHIGHO2_01_FULL_51_10 TaxID=1802723 RepID=A0A1G2S804_9BACT|nr:MAG: hypothetical protein A2675_02970 [Candidatus Yonathbacteria bacterium RIFCSPHIGHO2_01_FULL_51_10]